MIAMVTVNSNASQKGRIPALDIAKGIGILLVVFAHVNYTPALLTYIYSFHMPLFFLLSGMLFRKEKYRSFGQFAKRRFFSLICPYLFFYILAMILRFGLDLIQQGFSYNLCYVYYRYFLQMFIAKNSFAVICAPLWFVPCLFLAESIYYFVAKLKPAWILIVCGMLTCAGWLLESRHLALQIITLPWSFDSALFAIGFYAIGNLSSGCVMSAITKIECSKHKTALTIGGALFFALLLVPVAFGNGKISLGSKILNNGFLLYLSGILGTISVLFASVLLSNSRFLRYCGQNSFCIMATHFLIRKIYMDGFRMLGWKVYDETKLSDSILPFLAILALSLLCTWLYNKAHRHISRWKRTA